MKQLVRTLTLSGFVLVTMIACQTDARQQLMATSESQVALRSMQTRAFDTTERIKTLTTVIATLQDLEFLIDKADASLGVVTATKTKKMKHLRMSVTIHPKPWCGPAASLTSRRSMTRSFISGSLPRSNAPCFLPPMMSTKSGLCISGAHLA
jgi:hypothetical protein